MLAELRLKEAECLLQAGMYDGAYYLAGYAVECALKACIAEKTRQYDFPEKKLVEKSYTHDLVTLLGVAGLASELEKRQDVDTEFDDNWTIVNDWSEKSRYQRSAEAKAGDMVRAVADPNTGVLEWLKAYW